MDPTPTVAPQAPSTDGGRSSEASLPPAAHVLPPALLRGLGTVVVVISVLVLISAVAGAGAAGLNTPRIWFLLGFELVIIVAAIFAGLVGLGRFAEGPALGLACAAGVIAAGSFLGYYAGRGNLGIDLRPFLLARTVAGGGLAIAAALAVIGRRPRLSVPRLGIGTACAVAFIAACAAVWKFSGALSNLGTLTGALLGLFAGAAMLGLLAAAVHLIIGAFEAGSVEEPASSQ